MTARHAFNETWRLALGTLALVAAAALAVVDGGAHAEVVEPAAVTVSTTHGNA